MGSIGLYRSYAALLAAALVPIWAGSLKELQAEKRKKEGTEAVDDGEEDDEEEEPPEKLSSDDALWFPIIGSAVLLGLFLLFRYLDKRLLNRIIGAYFAVLGVAGMTRCLTHLSRRILGTERHKAASRWRLLLAQDKTNWLDVRLSSFSLGALFISLATVVAQSYTGYWVLVNLLALAFAYNFISLIALDSFRTGSILLAGLFIYDVWWVFGSQHVFGDNVMVKVATSFEGPIKIVFPRNLAAQTDFTLLGLGDIVLPGVFIALALRFDYHLALAQARVPFKPKAQRFAKPYFWACFAAYISGLCATMAAMHFFRAAQPALFYLSPACILSVATVAYARGEWKELWRYSEDEEETEEGRPAKKVPVREEPHRNAGTKAEARDQATAAQGASAGGDALASLRKRRCGTAPL
ncbi:hypothetical protein JCM8202v2_003127 [Rhodotorula sphaerocarpa]